jgi:hypothetical protein
MYKIMMFKKQYEKADICLAHAKYIAEKYSINFNFDTNPEHYKSIEEEGEKDFSVNPLLDSVYPEGTDNQIKIEDESEGE